TAAFMLISLENTHGAPARRRRPSLGFIRTICCTVMEFTWVRDAPSVSMVESKSIRQIHGTESCREVHDDAGQVAGGGDVLLERRPGRGRAAHMVRFAILGLHRLRHG